jgi:hypothetical protein
MIKPSIRFRNDSLRLTEWVFLLPVPRKLCDWKNVRRVWALNRNALTHDEVWITFETEDGSHHDVSETWAGFSQLREALPRLFPGIDQSWVDMHKATETLSEEDLLIWDRDGAGAPQPHPHPQPQPQ